MMKKISRFSTKSSIGARSMPWSSLSGACRRDCMIHRRSARSLRRAERDVVDAAEVDLVDDLDEHARSARLVARGSARRFRVRPRHALDVGAHGAHVDGAVCRPRSRRCRGSGSGCCSTSSSVGCLDAGRAVHLEPDSFTNTAVMMKKISRLITKSSIGARSMPWDDFVAVRCARRVRMAQNSKLVREQLGFPARCGAGSSRPDRGP